MRKLNIWVLTQDEPPNHTVLRFKDVFEADGHLFKSVNPNDCDIIVTKDSRKSILLHNEEVPLPDVVIPRMGAETTYFGLAVIRHLERLGVLVLNSSESIDMAKDKMFSLQILAEHGLPLPKTQLVKSPVNVELIEKNIGFPAVIKTISGNQGKGVFMAENKGHFKTITEILSSTNRNYNLLIQEMITDSYGMDLRVFVIGGRAIGCMKRTSAGDFRANISAGGSGERFEMTEEIKWLACEATAHLGLDIAGVDLLFSGDFYKICEVNSAPGFKGFEEATGISIPEEILKYIKIKTGYYLKK